MTVNLCNRKPTCCKEN